MVPPWRVPDTLLARGTQGLINSTYRSRKRETMLTSTHASGAGAYAHQIGAVRPLASSRIHADAEEGGRTSPDPGGVHGRSPTPESANGRRGSGPLERHQYALDPARTNPALDLDGGDRLERPALLTVLVEHLLELLAGHLAPEQALSQLHDLVLRHGALLSSSASSCQRPPRSR